MIKNDEFSEYSSQAVTVTAEIKLKSVANIKFNVVSYQELLIPLKINKNTSLFFIHCILFYLKNYKKLQK